MTREEEDEREFKEWWEKDHTLKPNVWLDYYAAKIGFIEGRRTLRKKNVEDGINFTISLRNERG